MKCLFTDTSDAATGPAVPAARTRTSGPPGVEPGQYATGRGASPGLPAPTRRVLVDSPTRYPQHRWASGPEEAPSLVSEKLYLSAQDLLEDGFRLGRQVVESGFRPTFIVALWRGGAPIGIALQEYLDFCGIATDHIAVRTSSYSGIDGRSREVAIYGMNYVVKNIRHEDSLLIVDDVFDTGRTIEALIEHLRAKARRNAPHDVRVAVPYYKPARNQTAIVPDYYLHETERWIKFPHSLEGLTPAEIREHRPKIYAIVGHLLEGTATGAAADA